MERRGVKHESSAEEWVLYDFKGTGDCERLFALNLFVLFATTIIATYSGKLGWW
jgi:hypothetical protein